MSSDPSHSHDHGSHGHGPHDHRAGSRRRLAWTLALVVLYMGAEVVGGLLTGSLALLSDAGHMLSDAASLALALFALWIAARPRSPERTFGYHRTEILAALANGVTLLVVAVFIVVEAWERFAEPPEVAAGGLMVVAAGGLLVNLAGLWLLHGGRHDSLNLRGAWLHVVSDLLGSVQALAAGAVIWAFGWAWADPLAAVLIAVLIVASSWTLLRDSVNVLMEGTPRHLDAEEIAGAIAAVAGVDGVHDLHVWTITSGFESLSVHVHVADRDRQQVLDEVRDLVRDRFAIDHATIQVESEAGCIGCD
ncbi:MAG TPA: cation diffusion facilitator family transporter [Thermoanaerobaculia bacterium]|nr:cation diffusion facilitator family transporter [Thermoanaerobaculia bacterium]